MTRTKPGFGVRYLATGISGTPRDPNGGMLARSRMPHSASDRATLCALARTSLRARRLRNRYLPRLLFGEPAWEMLLALYLSSFGEARQTISRLSRSSGAPPTTAQRWINYIIRAGFASRSVNPTDKRVTFIDLTDKGREAIEAYLSELIAEGIASPRMA